jgi:hypothetical protein
MWYHQGYGGFGAVNAATEAIKTAKEQAALLLAAGNWNNRAKSAAALAEQYPAVKKLLDQAVQAKEALQVAQMRTLTQAAQVCQSMGGAWDGQKGTCKPSTATQSAVFKALLAAKCSGAGGKLDPVTNQCSVPIGEMGEMGEPFEEQPKWKRYLIWGGLGLGGAALIYFVARKRGRK